MALSLNRVQLLGHVGGDPEVFGDQDAFEQGRGVARFSLATNERYRTRDGNMHDSTQWHRVVCFGPRARFVSQYVRKGARLYIEGRVEYDEYTKQDGSKGNSTQIVVVRVDFVEPKQSDDGGGGRYSAPPAAGGGYQGASSGGGGGQANNWESWSKGSSSKDSPDDDVAF